MPQISLNTVINDFDHLTTADKEYALELFKKNLTEARREKLAGRAGQAYKNWKSGKTKSGTAKNLLQDLANG